MKLPSAVDVPVEDRGYTILEFCAVERFSPPTYFKLRNMGFGPEEIVIPGTKLVRITADARRAWHARMHKLAQTKAAKLERERRSRQSIAAGKSAAASPKHNTKRKAEGVK